MYRSGEKNSPVEVRQNVLCFSNIDFAIASEAKELRSQHRFAEALELLELRIGDVKARYLVNGDGTRVCIVPRADIIDPHTFFLAAKLHVELSHEGGDDHRQRARGYLVEILHQQRDNAFAWQLLGDINESEGRLRSAVRCYWKAAQHDRQSAPAYGKLCGALIALKEFALARKAADRLLMLDSESPIAWFLKAKIELRVGDLVAAREAADQTLRLDPVNLASRVMKTRIELKAHDFLAARKAWYQALELSPNDPMLWGFKTQLELAAGDLHAARQAVERRMELDPANAIAWALKALVELEAGDTESARRAADMSAELEPLQSKSWGLKTKVELAAGDIDAARRSVERAIAIAPNDVVALGLKSEVELEEGNNDAALRSVERILELDPRDICGWGLLARVALRTDDKAALQRAVGELQRLDPGNVRAILYQGRIALQQDDPVTALRCAEQLMQHFRPTHLHFLRCLVTRGYMKAEHYQKIVDDLCAQGAIEANGTYFSLTKASVRYTLEHLDRELFSFDDDRASLTHPGMYSTRLVSPLLEEE